MTIAALAAQLDGRHFDHIIGVPRGGLIVAAGLGYLLDVRQVSAFGVNYERCCTPPHLGNIYCLPQVDETAGEHLLIVDDGVATGTLLEYAADWYRHHTNWLRPERATVTTAAVWVSSSHGYRPDVWVEERSELPSGASLLGLGVS